MTSDGSSNLWRATTEERVEAPPLQADKSVDIAIVGGGFTGTSAALEAAHMGASVCLLEAKTIGHGGSGRNVGLVNAGLWLPPDTIVSQLGKAAGQKLIDTLGAAPETVFALIEHEAIACEAVRNGTLHLAHSKAGLRDLQERHNQGLNFGAPLELFGREDAAQRTGSQAFYGALWDPRAGTIQPLSYCNGLARAARQKGASLHARSPVTEIQRQGESWVLAANGWKVTARTLLIATNAYHFGIKTPFKPDFVPVNYCQFATAPMPPELREKILPHEEGCWDTALVMSSFRTDREGRLIVGGMGDAQAMPGAFVHPGWARRKLRNLFPEAANLPFEHAWSGRIAMTRDHIPKIVAFGPQAYACFGYSGRGIGPGTVFGMRAAAALLTGSEEGLPVAPVEYYTERFLKAKSAYYEFGSIMVHLTAR